MRIPLLPFHYSYPARHGPLRAMADVAGQGAVSRDLIAQALDEGRQHGLITSREIAELRRRGTPPEWFNKLLDAKR